MKEEKKINGLKLSPYGSGEIAYAVGKRLDDPPDDLRGSDLTAWHSGWERARARHARYKERQK